MIGDLPIDASDLMARAAGIRDQAFGRRITYSPKVFLPVTNLCRNRCTYCSFRRSPGDPGEWTMSPDEVLTACSRARDLGCVEALLCLGDTPETGFPAYRALLRSWGHATTVDYLEWIGDRALALGLLPHTNAGILSAESMRRLERVNVSLGLMLETASDRLAEPGQPHGRAPDKRPAVRMAMIRTAGELEIPFTSGILVGFGETRAERVAALVALRDAHATHGHLQEVIVQPFRPGPATAMAAHPGPSEDELAWSVAVARILLPPDVSVQSPPNLTPASIDTLLRAGIDDLGGISPLTPDYINPGHPWPHLARLGQEVRSHGFALEPRLPVYDRFVDRPGFVHPHLQPFIRAVRARIAA